MENNMHLPKMHGSKSRQRRGLNGENANQVLPGNADYKRL